MAQDSLLLTVLFGGLVGFLLGYLQAWHTATKLERLNLKPSDWHGHSTVGPTRSGNAAYRC